MISIQDITARNEATAPRALADWMDRNLSRPMFALSIAYLAVASGVIHRVGHGHITLVEMEQDLLGNVTGLEVHLIAWSLVLLWPLFAAEAVLRFLATRHRMGFRNRFWIFFGVVLFPPIRLGLHSVSDPGMIWLPSLGWHKVERSLRRRMEKFFSVPMILIALMVLPVLALEYFWEEQVRSQFGLSLGLDIANSIIWMAFALEFILMVSVAERRIAYCIQNWMDLAIVILPLIDFLPILRIWRLGQLLRLNQLNRMSRLYRLRGMLMKAWRAILLLEMITRLLGNYKERRLKKLRDLVTAKEIELAELRQEMRELQEELDRKQDAAVATQIENSLATKEVVAEGVEPRQ